MHRNVAMDRILARSPRHGAGEYAGRSRPTAKVALAVLAALAVVAGAVPPARAQQSAGLPQAFLLGSWTGGLFPAPGVVSAEQCLAQPTVIFTRDVVLRATVTDQFYIERLIETARGTGNGVEFHFNAAPPASTAAALPGLATTGASGFGCENPDALHVTTHQPERDSVSPAAPTSRSR